VRRHSRNAHQEDIAYAVGVDQSTVARWLDLERWNAGKRPMPDQVVKFAKAYGRKPVEAFIAAGYLAPEDITGPVEIAVSMDNVSDEDLVKGLADRLARYRRRHDGEDGLVSDDWGEDPGMDGVQNRN
jgi:transcriptional regulator with XRE-family HTH domain